jgi:hypothetical protein
VNSSIPVKQAGLTYEAFQGIKKCIQNFRGKRFENKNYQADRGGYGKIILQWNWEILRMGGGCNRF